MKIGLAGYFGWGNYGDELFFQIHHQIFVGHELIIFHDPIKNELLPNINQLIESVDAIVIGGGDLLMPWFKSWLYFDERFLGKPVFVFGVGVPDRGINPDPAVLAHYQKFLSHSSVELLACRDQESIEWLQTHLKLDKEILFYPDMALSLAFPQCVLQSRSVGVVLRNQPTYDNTELFKVANLVSQFGYSLKLILLGTESITLADDYQALLHVRIPNCEIVIRDTTQLLSKEIASCRYLLSTRFHGLVAAYKSGVPFISLNIDSKFTSFMMQTGNGQYSSYWTDENLSSKFERLVYEGTDFSNRTSLTTAAKKGLTRLAEAVLACQR